MSVSVRSTAGNILGKDDLILSDELNHASIIDGCRLSRDAFDKDADCERLCKETEKARLLITDGVFSMDGEHRASAPESGGLAEKFNCIMMVDDAHSSGVLARARWTISAATAVCTSTSGQIAMGGYVCGSRELIDFLCHRARPFIRRAW